MLHLVRRQAGKRDLRLIRNQRVGVARLALLLLLADADDRGQARLDGRQHALVHRRIRLAEVLAALAVAENDVFHAGFLEHCGAQLAGVRAGFLPVHVLRAELDVRALDDLAHRGKVNGRGADDHVALRILDQRHERGNQLARLAGGLVHFPVAGNNRLTHKIVPPH